MLCKVDTVEMMPTEHDLDLILSTHGVIWVVLSGYRGIWVPEAQVPPRHFLQRRHPTFEKKQKSNSTAPSSKRK